MSIKTIIIKNVDTVDHTYAGQLILAGEAYTIQSMEEQNKFCYDPTLNIDLWSTPVKIVVSNGVDDMSSELGDKYLKDVSLDEPDGRIVVHNTPRKRGLVSYFTGCGDSDMNQFDVGGGGQMINATHLDTDMMTQYYRIYFNTVENETHIHSGYLQWVDALNDKITLEFIPKVTTTTAGTSTNYNLYGGYLVVPAVGDGTLAITPGDEVLVGVPLNEEGIQAGAGYWDADWNYTTKEFDNMAPNYTGEGAYNMFSLEVVLDRFINKQCMLGSSSMHIVTSDASMIGHNMGIRFTIATMGTNHTWSWNSSLSCFRRKTT